MLTKTGTLAIDGGTPAVTLPIRGFNTIGRTEASAAYGAIMTKPLSGYLGGELIGGYHVEKLEREWCEKFKVKHAVACNSATSGLLIACMAANIGRGSTVVTTPYTMSATATAPAFLDAKIVFQDIDEKTFCLGQFTYPGPISATIAVNLFGQPAMVDWMRNGDVGIVIEDNAQGMLAIAHPATNTWDCKYAGTVGHMGVFSGNVHKSVQCGEGGMVVTNDDGLADKLRHARNHGEMAGGPVGLNLRLTEVQAAIWSVQLAKADWIVSNRVATAEAIIEGASCIPGITVPFVRPGRTHVYYCIPFLVDEERLGMSRERFVDAMQAEGVPLREGYTTPLYKLPTFRGNLLPVTEKVEASMVIYENCAWNPSPKQIKQFGVAFRKVADANKRS